MKFLLICFFTFLVSACAGTQQLAPTVVSNLQTISIDSKVDIPKIAYYNGPETAAGAVFGGLLGIVVDDIERDKMHKKSELITLYIQKNKIDLQNLVLQEVVQQLKKHPKMLGKQIKVQNNPTNISLKITIISYGIGQSFAFSNDYRPTLGVVIEMFDVEGKTLWSNYDTSTELNSDIEKVPFDKYFENPDYLKSRYQKLAVLTVKNIMKGL
jgi:hypothetical protein